jgi:hypothetical protein
LPFGAVSFCLSGRIQTGPSGANLEARGNVSSRNLYRHFLQAVKKLPDPPDCGKQAASWQIIPIQQLEWDGLRKTSGDENALDQETCCARARSGMTRAISRFTCAFRHFPGRLFPGEKAPRQFRLWCKAIVKPL